MIWRPKPGQRVLIRYRKSTAFSMPFHGVHATVERAANGPGPINAQVRTDTGRRTIVPRGNLTIE